MYGNVAPSRDAWIRQEIGVGALRAIVEALGVDAVLPVKGIVTARTLYADPAERPIFDVDVRIDRSRFDDAVAFGRARGVLRTVEPFYGNAVIDVDGIDLDVETTIGPPGLVRLDPKAMLARSVRGDAIFGFPVRVPELHDHVLALCVNLFKDKLVLVQPWSVEDLVRLVETPGFDPALLVARAREARCPVIAWIVADAFADRSAPLRAVRAAFGPRPPRPGFARLYRLLARRAPSSLATRILARTASNDPAMQLDALARAALYSARRLVVRSRAR
jgi:hypothetical protein